MVKAVREDEYDGRRDDGVARNDNGIGGRISSDNAAPIRRSASVVDAIVCETADAGGANVHIVGGNDSNDEETESCDHEDGGGERHRDESLLRACDLPRRTSCSGEFRYDDGRAPSGQSSEQLVVRG